MTDGGEPDVATFLRVHHDQPLADAVHRHHERLERRVIEHREKRVPGFTARYNLDLLAHYEEFTDVVEAISREKVLKGWTRAKKIALIEEHNPHGEDFARDWYAGSANNSRPPRPLSS